MTTFLIKAMLISLSGVMAPGSMTAVTLGLGSRNRHAGALLAVGHGLVEFPLMVLIVLGASRVLETGWVQMLIALGGGAILLHMGAGMLGELARPVRDIQARRTTTGPVLAGVLASAGNPYFLLWWAVVGLGLATEATRIGIWAFVLFAVLHWTLDLVWLEALSLASYSGTRLLGPRVQQAILLVCGSALLLFGVGFLHDAILQALAEPPPGVVLSGHR